ncbi:hypothetical protein NHX12_023176, partial [Muraenolepis orangiensis]
MSNIYESAEATLGFISSPCLAKVELRVASRGISDRDALSKPDPCVVLKMQSHGQWFEVDRTEVIRSSINPVFSKVFLVDFYFEEVQRLRFELLDISSAHNGLRDADFLGAMECTLGQRKLSKALLKQGNTAGKSSITVAIDFTASNGDPRNSCSLHYIHPYQPNEYLKALVALHHQTTPSYTTKLHQASPPNYIKLHQTTPSFTTKLHQASPPNYTTKLHHQTTPSYTKLHHQTTPSFTKVHQASPLNYTTKLHQASPNYTKLHQASPPNYTKLHQTTPSYTTKLHQASPPNYTKLHHQTTPSFTTKLHQASPPNYTKLHHQTTPSFTTKLHQALTPNYTKLHQTTPSYTTKLHQATPNTQAHTKLHQATPPSYTKLHDQTTPSLTTKLHQASLPNYTKLHHQTTPPNYTKKYQMWLTYALPLSKVSHDFAVNFDEDNPECAGIQGVVEAYQNCLPKIQLYGPTNIAPIIQKVASTASEEMHTKEAMEYFILLILTDGVITDMADTREAIVHASHLPMSVIIVGVGNADFTDMQILDGDDGILRSPKGEPVLRDIVQFVPFKDFKH